MKIMNIVGARPNFMKIAPVIEELQKVENFEAKLLHTGQHYDASMSRLFFEDLSLPEPDIYLGIGSGNHGEQTGRIMIQFESVLIHERPDLVIVVGDVNSTIACGLVAVKQGVQLAHIEAGLRSFDRNMPEEINRILTDQISDFLFVTEESGKKNLLNEGVDAKKIHFVGNVMIDSLLQHVEKAKASGVLQQYKLQSAQYVALTLHRPANVDSPENFLKILNALNSIQKEIPIVFPVHPRSRLRLQQFALLNKIEQMPGVVLIEPLGYLDFLKLISEAKFVLTDSGGIQEETTVLGVPCLTLRENTERPVTVTQGTNKIIGHDTKRIVEESFQILNGVSKNGRCPDLWDGKAAARIVEILVRNYQ